MKCKHCTSEVDPKWTFAIKQNICPFCGDSILDQQLVDGLVSLDQLILSLSPYKEDIVEFLKLKLIDFNCLILTNEEYALLNKKTEKQVHKTSEPDNTEGKKTIDKFYERTDIKQNLEEKDRLKDLVKKIQQSGSDLMMLSDDGQISQETIQPKQMNYLLEEYKAKQADDDDYLEDEVPDMVYRNAAKHKGNNEGYVPKPRKPDMNNGVFRRT